MTANTTTETNTIASLSELKSYAEKAEGIERVILHVRSALDAIDLGELLSAQPATAVDREKHWAAVGLISMARESLVGLDTLPGTDLSIFLSCMASEAARPT